MQFNVLRVDKSGLAEKSLPMLRRDFTDQSHCCLCKGAPHPLKSGKGIILEHPSLGEIAAGPDCGSRYGKKPTGPLPDLTRAVLDPAGEGNGGGGGVAASRQSSADNKRKWAVEYLLLRQKLLPDLGFKGVAWGGLEDAHKAYDTGTLTDRMVQTIAHVMETCERQRQDLSLDNLQRCYAAGYWLKQCRKTRDNEFLKSLDDQLVRKRSLSPKQLDALNQDIQKFYGEHAPQLKQFTERPSRPTQSVQQRRYHQPR